MKDNATYRDVLNQIILDATNEELARMIATNTLLKMVTLDNDFSSGNVDQEKSIVKFLNTVVGEELD